MTFKQLASAYINVGAFKQTHRKPSRPWDHALLLPSTPPWPAQDNYTSGKTVPISRSVFAVILLMSLQGGCATYFRSSFQCSCSTHNIHIYEVLRSYFLRQRADSKLLSVITFFQERRFKATCERSVSQSSLINTVLWTVVSKAGI